MDDQYRQVYEAIYNDRARYPDNLDRPAYFDLFADHPLQPRAGRAIDGAVTRAERLRRDGAGLRADAKALLAVNFQEMVFVPLAAVGRVGDDEIEQVVRQDIATLVSAAEPSWARGEREITGHQIVSSLSRNWANLGLSRFNLWENGDE
jgi:hypothetical protein